MSRWAQLGLFFALPLQAAWFAGLAALWGIWYLLRERKPYLGVAFVIMAVFGTLGQLLSSQAFVPTLVPPPYVQVTTGGAPNPISPLLHELSGWNPKDSFRREARRVDQGFWRFPRYSTRSGIEYREFLTGRWYPVEAGRTYTQSFYLRHDGTEARIAIAFFTRKGYHAVPVHMQEVAPKVWRAWATYTVQEGDKELRAVDFINNGGDYSYLDIGWPQLEQGSTPTAYRMGPTGLMPQSWRVWWWVGAVLMGFLVLQAGVWFFRQLSPQTVAQAVLLGMLALLGYAGWQWLEVGPGGRVAGLTPQPNILGHGAVMLAGLVWVLGGRRLGGLALVVAGLLLWVSGSRTAFWAMLLLGTAWGWSLGRYRFVALGLAGLLGAIALWQPELLGRFAQALTLDHNAQARLQFWWIAWQAMWENPLGGIGFGNFALYFDLNPPPQTIEYTPGHAHNLVLQLLAEGGGLALFGFLLWLAIVLRVLWRAKAASVMTLALLALVLNSLDFTFFSAWVYYPLLLAFAWVVAQEKASTTI